MTNDQSAFLARIQDHRLKGAQALLDHGVEPDQLLIEELRVEGVDQRYGVNLVVRPPQPVICYIQAVQERLRAHEPGQHFYPAADLHLTLVEICSSRARSEAEAIATAVAQALPEMLETAPQALLMRPQLGYDQRACVLHFIPSDHALQTLRHHLVNQLALHAVTVAPRYMPQSAHVTLLRYLQQLRTDPATWVEALTHAAPDSGPDWYIDSIWLTWGATWYGRQRRMQMRGPYPLHG